MAIRRVTRKKKPDRAPAEQWRALSYMVGQAASKDAQVLAHDTFPSIAALADYLAEDRPLWTEGLSRTEEREFYGVSLVEALTLARQGWPEGLAEMQRLAIEVPHETHENPRRRWPVGVAGVRPLVPLYCSGAPAHLQTPVSVPFARPVTRIAFSGGYSWQTEHHEVMSLGLAILGLVDALEDAGQSVELSSYSLAVNQGADPWTLARLEVVVKQAGQPLDLDALAFACAHPSYNRRLRFGWHETQLALDPATARNGAKWASQGVSVTLPAPMAEGFDLVIPILDELYEQVQTPADARTAIAHLWAAHTNPQPEEG